MPQVFYLLMLGAVCAAAQTVEGKVIDSATGNGVAGAKVEIVRVRTTASSTGTFAQLERENRIDAIEGNAAYSATTDEQGRFRIEDVKDGAYTARYSAPKYLDEAYAPAREPAAPRRFQVTAGGSPVNLEGRMIQFGRVTGRVIDGRGEAVRGARLDLTTGALVGSSDTDADGKFSMALLPGAAYTLTVFPPFGWKPPDPQPDSDHVMGWARTYYPGVAVREAASRIVLPPGGELLNIEMKLAAVPVHAVRGVLLNPDGTPAPKVEITLGEDRATPALRVASKADGTFEFPAVVDGEWRFFVEVENGGVNLRALQWKEMAGRDVEGLKLQLNAPFTVRGRVVMETPKGRTAPPLPSARLTPVSHGRGILSEPPLRVRPDADGNFNLEQVYPGAYRLNAPEAPVPPAYYLDAVRLGEAEVPAPEVELSSGALPITLVYKTNGGSVRGTVEKCASGDVVLVPQDPAMRWPGAIHNGRCDSGDHYEITAVRPGEYYALAFPADRSSPFWTPKFDDGLLNQANKITVRAGETSSGDLRAVVHSRY